ncbi:MAG: hypothetical protein M3Z01_05245 [Thermoproteota archaeon]|nr:hypothetical protein [Thermoproteota archaeon]
MMAIVSFTATYAYMNYFGPKTVIQADHDTINCKQGNVLEGEDRQSRFNILFTCEKVIGTVHDMKGIKENDGDYQFNISLGGPYTRFLN